MSPYADSTHGKKVNPFEQLDMNTIASSGTNFNTLDTLVLPSFSASMLDTMIVLSDLPKLIFLSK